MRHGLPSRGGKRQAGASKAATGRSLKERRARPGATCDGRPPVAATYGEAVNRDLFEHYAGDEARRGPVPDGAHTGSAGGAPCGDLIRISLLAEDGRVEHVTFDREGCSA